MFAPFYIELEYSNSNSIFEIIFMNTKKPSQRRFTDFTNSKELICELQYSNSNSKYLFEIRFMNTKKKNQI